MTAVPENSLSTGQRFDLTGQADQYRKSAKTPKYVFSVFGALVVVVGLWILFTQVPRFNLGAVGYSEGGATLVLGFGFILWAVFLRPPQPCTGLVVGEIQLQFQRGNERIDLPWRDPTFRLILSDVSADPRSSTAAKQSYRFVVKAPVSLVGAVPRAGFDAIVGKARSLGLSVTTLRREFGVPPTRHVFDVVTIEQASRDRIAL